MKKWITLIAIIQLYLIFAQIDSTKFDLDETQFDTINNLLNNERLDTTLHSKDSLSLIKRTGIWQDFKSDVGLMVGGFLNAYKRPLHWKKDDYITVGATVIGIGLLYTVDHNTSDFFTRHKEDVPHFFRQTGWYFGNLQNNYGLTGAVYLTGLLTHNEKVRRTGVLMITSASATGLIQQVAKSATGRARPNTDLGKGHFKPFGGSATYRSFPSGHTVLSITTTYALSKQFSNPWVKAGIMSVGAIAPISRLLEGAHWLTDVALSTIMSIAIVDGVDKYMKQKTNDQAAEYGSSIKRKVNWRLAAGATSFGIVGTF